MIIAILILLLLILLLLLFLVFQDATLLETWIEFPWLQQSRSLRVTNWSIVSGWKMQIIACNVLQVLSESPQQLHWPYNNDGRYSKYNTSPLVIWIGFNRTLTDEHLFNWEIDSNIAKP